MRVLHVIPAVARRYGGPSRAVLGMCRGLHRHQVETVILTTDADGPGTLPVPSGCITSFENVPTIFFSRRGEGFKFSRGLACWLDENVGQFDVVHIHAVFSHASLSAARACRKAGVPYVLRPLGSLDPWSLAQSAWKKRVLLWTSGYAMLEGAAAIHYTTHEEADLAAPVAGRAPAVVIPLGLEADEIAAESVAGDRDAMVLALTRLHPKKNLEALIQAFDEATRDPALSGWTLCIGGDGEPRYRARVRAIAEASPSSARITFAGWVDGEAKRRLLDRAALFAAPSRQENFGLGILEACGRGTPVVVSRAVNLSAEIEHAGAGWVAADDSAGLTRVLREAMADSADRVRRGRAARDLAAGYSWERVAESLRGTYLSIANARGAKRAAARAALAPEGRR